MMEKMDRKNKKVTVIISLLVVAILSGLFAAGCSSSEDGYRVIRIYEVSGNATLQRENVGEMDAYENLNLISGDFLSVLSESYLRLKMDEDKYMLVEENSMVSIYATGTEKESKTNIQLEKGAVTIEVQNKLNEDSAFEVTTPNSVMAIRGTVFRITTDVDDSGNPITEIDILEGSVAVQKVMENGEASEEILVPSGKGAIIYVENEEEKISIKDQINIENVSISALEFLKDVSENGRDITFSQEELEQELLRKREALEETETFEESEESDTLAENEESDTQTQNKQDKNVISDTNEGQSTDNTVDNNVNNTGNGGFVGAEQKEIYTVNFMYQGKIFATQKVEKGMNAAEPLLMPAESGHWDFDFSKVIEKDTAIKFVED